MTATMPPPALGGSTPLGPGAALAGVATATTPLQPTATTSGPPTFRRAPREHVAPPADQIRVDSPPQMPNPPSGSLFEIFMPVMFGILISVGTTFAFYYYLSRGSGATGNTGVPMTGYLLLTSAPALVSIFPTLYLYLRERRLYRQALVERAEEYRAYLADVAAEAQTLADRQRRASLVPNPPLDGADGCRVRAERRDVRLWERSPKDSDFLDLRLGEGTAPASFSIAFEDEGTRRRRRRDSDTLLTEAHNLLDRFDEVSPVAVTLPLAKVGMAGIAGARANLQNTVRALIMQLATHHSPTEVKLVITSPEAERQEWDWVRWLPHTWSDDRSHRYIAAVPSSGGASVARDMLVSRYDVLKQRRLQKSSNQDDALPAVLPFYVFIFADPRLFSGSEAAALGPLQELLLSEGPALGAFSIFLADRRESVPQACGAVADLRAGGRLHLIGPPAVDATFTPDVCDVSAAESFARVLAPLRVQRLNASGEIQYVVPLIDLFGVKRFEEIDVLGKWKESEPYRSLAAPIGVRAGGELLELDFHEKGHGPHGLEAGATGSGKSELLQSMIASIAMNYHPHEVAFVLIDYKGGGMANPFRDLPHQIGIITNLGGNLTTRALNALRAELQRRQRLLAEVGVSNIDKYLRLQREGKVPAPLPHLILIADEFAELAQNQPDFMSELISAVRIGRSLGVHLLLGTQKPAGVVNDQIWGNTKFRLCLRVERPEDSREVLKRPDAAALRAPGRAYFQVGMDEVFELFQSGFAGAPYNPTVAATDDQREIFSVALDGTRQRLTEAAVTKKASEMGPTQLEAAVSYIRDVAAQASIERLPEFWLPPLPTAIALDEIRAKDSAATGGWNGRTWQPTNHWLAPLTGILDDPAHQAQNPIRLDIGKEGHLSIVGTPGSGKTTLLHTLVTSLVQEHSPEDVWLYLLDFGGLTLKLYEPLPHVGAVILPDEGERLQRLFVFLFGELERRKGLLASSGAGTLATYRADPSQTGEKPPALILAIDNYTEFAEAYPDLVEQLTRIGREGANYGIHLVLTSSAANAVTFRLNSNIALKVALEMNDPADYTMVVGRTGGLAPSGGIQGRGLVNTVPPLEFQTALPAPGETTIAQTAGMRTMVAQMAAAWDGRRAAPIQTLPDVAPLANIVTPTGQWSAEAGSSSSTAVPVGIDAASLDPFLVDLNDGPHFLIAGPPASGKTTLIQSWLLALANRLSPERLHLYIGGLGSATLLPFSGLPHTGAYIESDEHLTAVVEHVQGEVSKRQAALDEARRAAGGILDEETLAALRAQWPALVFAIDDFDQFQVSAGDTNKASIADLMRRGRGLGLHVITAGPTSEFNNAYDGMGRALKMAQTGFLTGTTEMDDLNLFNIRLPTGEAGKPVPPGRSIYTRRGRYQMLQVATCHAGQPTFREWVTEIASRPTADRAEIIPVPPPPDSAGAPADGFASNTDSFGSTPVSSFGSSFESALDTSPPFGSSFESALSGTTSASEAGVDGADGVDVVTGEIDADTSPSDAGAPTGDSLNRPAR